MLATCICLNGSLLDQLSCTIVYLHNLFTCTFGRMNMSVCLSVCPNLSPSDPLNFVSGRGNELVSSHVNTELKCIFNSSDIKNPCVIKAKM